MSRQTEILRDYAPLVLRIAGGVVFAIHGYMKVFGGMEKFGATIASLNLPPYFMYVGALVEFVGGLCLIIGLLVRAAAFLLAGQMMVAVVKFHILYLKQPLVGGYEFPLSLAAMMLALFLFGSGRWSLDRRLFGWK